MSSIGIRQYVRFAAAQPELFRLMVEEGKHSDARMRWFVDTRLKAPYEGFEHVVSAYAPDSTDPSCRTRTTRSREPAP